jgi:DNA mismatch endonuclease (patch repair protein)
MALVHSKDTTPELIVRSTLHRLGYRFSLSSQKLPGKPDIVLSRFHKLIFVHGCFWHQHKNCKASERPSSNTCYWNNKLDRNISRDKKNIASLKKSGWDVLIIWECQIRKIHFLSSKLAKFMQRPNKRLRFRMIMLNEAAVKDGTSFYNVYADLLWKARSLNRGGIGLQLIKSRNLKSSDLINRSSKPEKCSFQTIHSHGAVWLLLMQKDLFYVQKER